MNRVMVFAGICTLLQALGQMVFTAIGICQHFCIIDFLRELPLLLYIRILYFHNPNGCGTRINIGQAIDGIIDQAFISQTREPFTAFRTFVINCTGLGLSVFWIITSVVIMIGGAKDKQSVHVKWPWLLVSVCQCGVDLAATVIYANDSFHTRTLSDIMDFIGGTASGISNVQLNTAWAAWTMVILYSRFVLLFALNVLLIILIIVGKNANRVIKETIAVQVEAPATPAADPVAPIPPLSPPPEPTESSDQPDADESSTPSAFHAAGRIPRAGLSQSFRRMKEYLFRRMSIRRSKSQPSLDGFQKRSAPVQHVEETTADKKRTVNFPESLLSLPQRLENMIAEQQRRLDSAVIDTAARRSPTRTSQSLPQLANNLTESKGRRGTTAELQGQLPWAYIPASAHRMRDQLPPDEDLPPVPLPDYTAIPSFRKASVHRAASSLSSLTQKKDYASQSTRPPLNQADVLY